ncbi:MAG: DNA mismatch repair endonuclease MutH [Labilithrix sp.]|nr:DNA mismatch repair endonuclease MutH [Labilithrix sp.]MBX3221618.1 DNA mismatch repair endonuclease MutH [Labilithrix sp.]
MAPPLLRPPPETLDELLARARSLAGLTLGEVLRDLGLTASADPVRTKGSAGETLERALGASGGSAQVLDFPDLGVELKTIPVTAEGTPLESTYVCTLSLADAELQEWDTSWVRAKLARVLFVPLVGAHGLAWQERVVGAPLLWSPTHEQDDVLRGDFDDVVGLIGVGRIEELTAHRGRWLQVRPKARDGSARAIAWGSDGEAIATVPRGFYLRARFTGALLTDPAALPD